jgi:hypothetical protein
MKLPEAAENFALCEWLSDWPSEWSYDEIIDAIRSDDYHENISVWEQVEDEPAEKIVEMIESTKWAFKRTFHSVINDMLAE